MTRTNERLAVVLATLLFGITFAPGAAAAARQDPLAGLDRSQRQIFERYTRLFCEQFRRYGEGRFVILPNHERKRENSTGRTYDEMQDSLTEVKRVKSGLIYVDKKVAPPDAEVIAAARILPDMEVGHYGFVNSLVVKEILGPEEMVVNQVTLIPQESVGTSWNTVRKRLYNKQIQFKYKTFRLLGFSTKSLIAGQTYYGPRKKGLHVAVMSTDKQHNYVMVSYDKLKRVRTNEFHEVLSYVKLEPLAFIDLVRENRESYRTEGDKQTLIAMYNRFYNRYRPAPAAQLAAADAPQPRVGRPVPPRPPVTNSGTTGTGTAVGGGPSDTPNTSGRPSNPETGLELPKPAERQEPQPDEDEWDPDKDSGNSGGSFFGIPL